MSITRTHADLLRASRVIGDIVRSASWFTAQLAASIEQAGKPVSDMTVGELMDLYCQHADATDKETAA